MNLAVYQMFRFPVEYSERSSCRRIALRLVTAVRALNEFVGARVGRFDLCPPLLRGSSPTAWWFLRCRPEGARVEVHLQADRSEASFAAIGISPSELRKLPREERQAILAATSALAEEVYRDDKDLTGFVAFSEEIDDDSGNSGI